MQMVSDVIAKLQQLIEEHGDMQVAEYDSNYEMWWGRFAQFQVRVSDAANPDYAHDPNSPVGEYVPVVGKYVIFD